MVRFPFYVNNSFLETNNHLLTVPKHVYDQLEREGLVGLGDSTIICPDGSRATGYIYSGNAGYGPYYQIRFHSTPRNLFGSLPLGERISVEIGKESNSLAIRLSRPNQRPSVAPRTEAAPPTDSANAVDIEEPTEETVRALTRINRIIRDTRLTLEIKELYRFRCQLCGLVIEFPDGRKYAEAHHIVPLGKPHNGPDRRDNILCVCPTCHVKLDYGIVLLDFSRINVHVDHSISEEAVRYHNENIYGQF